MLNPEEDGLTHVNVYSQGKTELGRLLSNFAHTPFWHAGYRFESVEAWWYWEQMVSFFLKGELPIKKIDFEKVRKSFGFESKKLGKFYLEGKSKIITPMLLEPIYRTKLEYNPNIQKLLLKNSLPLAHYYVYGNVIRPADKYLWTVELWKEIKNQIINI